MKAYQVFKTNFHRVDERRYELVATYLDKQRALDHIEEIAKNVPLKEGETLVDGKWYNGGTYKSWLINGKWTTLTASSVQEIEITE